MECASDIKDRTIGKQGFESILKEGRTPELLWIDQGSEFYNQEFKKLLEDYDIEMYHIFTK